MSASKSLILLVFLAGVCSGSLPADFNRDGAVDFSDFAVFAGQWMHGTDASYPVPKFTYCPSSLQLAVVRDSIAYDEMFMETPAHTARLSTECVCSRPTLLIDSSNVRRCFDVDCPFVICGDGPKLYFTTNADFNDGVNPQYTELVDVSCDAPFTTYYTGGDTVKSLKVMPDGYWVLAMGHDDANTQGYLFRSTDKGATWQVCQYHSDGSPFQLERGYPDYWGWTGVNGNEAVIGEYAYRLQENNPRRIYYTDNYGASWSKIYEPAAQSGRHCHLVTFAPNDTSVIYISYGDSDYRKLVKIEHYGGDKKDINNWGNESSEITLAKTQPTAAYGDGKYIYFGRDGSEKHPNILRLDTSNDNLETVLHIPTRQADCPESPYSFSGGTGDIFNITKYKGVLYAGNMVTQVVDYAELTDGGIYVSGDGENWLCAYRGVHSGPAGSVFGVESVRGFADGYLWGTLRDGTGIRLFKFEPLSAGICDALITETGVNNLLDSTTSKDGDPSGWAIFSPPNDNVTIQQSDPNTEPSLVGCCSLKVTGIDNGGTSAVLKSPTFGTTNDKYYCASFWVKAAESCSPEHYAHVEWYSGSRMTGKASFIRLTEGWQKINLWGQAIQDYAVQAFKITFNIPVNHSDMVCYIDAIQVVESDDKHYYGTWQVGDTMRNDEYGVYPLCGAGNFFTTSFEWQPKTGYAEFAADLAIASWIGSDNSYIDLIWDPCESRFVLTDDNGDTISSTANAYRFNHFDFVKVCLTSDGTSSALYLNDSLNGLAVIDANSVNLTGTPIALKLGTNHNETAWGCGCFPGCVRVWDTQLNLDDVKAVFDEAVE